MIALATYKEQLPATTNDGLLFFEHVIEHGGERVKQFAIIRNCEHWPIIRRSAESQAPFLTGSRLYGTPRSDSDIDVVMLFDLEDVKQLSGHGDDEKFYGDSRHVRLGDVNIIAMSDRKTFDAWREAAVELYNNRPVTRDQAVALIKAKVELIKRG